MASSSPAVHAPELTTAELRTVFIVAAIQFVNILDFMMVMPLGPDFAAGLAIPTAHLGYIGGAYTASAAVSGLVGAFFLDRFDRRSALAVAMVGLVLGTLAGAFAIDFPTLLLARVAAGAFGGPATAVALSIVADVVPPWRRGRAMGIVMGSFSAASVLGVPAGLELAARGSWRTPFLGVAALGAVVTILCIKLLPPMRGHLQHLRPPGSKLGELFALLSRKNVIAAYVVTGMTMMSGFVIIPNVSAHLQLNFGYPRSDLGLLYMAGGAMSFFTMQAGGRSVDRFGAFRVYTAAVAVFVAVAIMFFVMEQPPLPVIVLFVAFMVGQSLRGVSMQTLASRVPAPAERAGFSSLQSVFQHSGAAAGALVSSVLLVETADHRLTGMDTAAAIAITLSVSTLVILRWLHNSVVRAPSAASAARSPA